MPTQYSRSPSPSTPRDLPTAQSPVTCANVSEAVHLLLEGVIKAFKDGILSLSENDTEAFHTGRSPLRILSSITQSIIRRCPLVFQTRADRTSPLAALLTRCLLVRDPGPSLPRLIASVMITAECFSAAGWREHWAAAPLLTETVLAEMDRQISRAVVASILNIFIEDCLDVPNNGDSIEHDNEINEADASIGLYVKPLAVFCRIIYEDPNVCFDHPNLRFLYTELLRQHHSTINSSSSSPCIPVSSVVDWAFKTVLIPPFISSAHDIFKLFSDVLPRVGRGVQVFSAIDIHLLDFVFDEIDDNGNGSISLLELCTFLEVVGEIRDAITLRGSRGLREAAIDVLMGMDRNGDGLISRPEFVEFLAYLWQTKGLTTSDYGGRNINAVSDADAALESVSLPWSSAHAMVRALVRGTFMMQVDTRALQQQMQKRYHEMTIMHLNHRGNSAVSSPQSQSREYANRKVPFWNRFGDHETKRYEHLLEILRSPKTAKIDFVQKREVDERGKATDIVLSFLNNESRKLLEDADETDSSTSPVSSAAPSPRVLIPNSFCLVVCDVSVFDVHDASLGPWASSFLSNYGKPVNISRLYQWASCLTCRRCTTSVDLVDGVILLRLMRHIWPTLTPGASSIQGSGGHSDRGTDLDKSLWATASMIGDYVGIPKQLGLFRRSVLLSSLQKDAEARVHRILACFYFLWRASFGGGFSVRFSPALDNPLICFLQQARGIGVLKMAKGQGFARYLDPHRPKSVGMIGVSELPTVLATRCRPESVPLTSNRVQQLHIDNYLGDTKSSSSRDVLNKSSTRIEQDDCSNTIVEETISSSCIERALEDLHLIRYETNVDALTVDIKKGASFSTDSSPMTLESRLQCLKAEVSAIHDLTHAADVADHSLQSDFTPISYGSPRSVECANTDSDTLSNVLSTIGASSRHSETLQTLRRLFRYYSSFSNPKPDKTMRFSQFKRFLIDSRFYSHVEREGHSYGILRSDNVELFFTSCCGISNGEEFDSPKNSPRSLPSPRLSTSPRLSLSPTSPRSGLNSSRRISDMTFGAFISSICNIAKRICLGFTEFDSIRLAVKECLNYRTRLVTSINLPIIKSEIPIQALANCFQALMDFSLTSLARLHSFQWASPTIACSSIIAEYIPLCQRLVNFFSIKPHVGVRNKDAFRQHLFYSSAMNMVVIFQIVPQLVAKPEATELFCDIARFVTPQDVVEEWGEVALDPHGLSLWIARCALLHVNGEEEHHLITRLRCVFQNIYDIFEVKHASQCDAATYSKSLQNIRADNIESWSGVDDLVVSSLIERRTNGHVVSLFQACFPNGKCDISGYLRFLFAFNLYSNQFSIVEASQAFSLVAGRWCDSLTFDGFVKTIAIMMFVGGLDVSNSQSMVIRQSAEAATALLSSLVQTLSAANRLVISLEDRLIDDISYHVFSESGIIPFLEHSRLLRGLYIKYYDIANSVVTFDPDRIWRDFCSFLRKEKDLGWSIKTWMTFCIDFGLYDANSTSLKMFLSDCFGDRRGIVSICNDSRLYFNDIVMGIARLACCEGRRLSILKDSLITDVTIAGWSSVLLRRIASNRRIELMTMAENIRFVHFPSVKGIPSI